MFRGFQTAASGMIAQQRRTELLTNNMSNANTPGYKADQTSIRSFPEMLLSRVGSASIPTEDKISGKYASPVGAVSAGVYMQETIALQTQGQLKQTDINTDIALINGMMPTDEATGQMGTIFYRLEHPTGGEAYTRNGNFTLDGDGYLTNAQGLYVLDEDGQRIILANDDFRVGDDGQLFVNNMSVSRIGVAYSGNPETLLKQDNGLFRAAEGNNLPSAYDIDGISFSMQQGFIEGSNVDTAKTMTELMSAYRSFEANQKILQAYDQSMQKAVNEVGRVN